MNRRLASAAAILAVLAPLAIGCGGGSENTAQELPAPPTLTVPGDDKPPTVTESAGTTGATGATGPTSTQTSTTTTPAASTPGTAQGGAAAPQTGGATPDSPQNDQQPAAGTPADKFESFCDDNPGAC